MIAAQHGVLVRARASHALVLGARVTGVLFVAIVSALLWSGIIALAASAFGVSITPAALAVTGIAIAVFLTAVCAPLMLQS